MTEYTNANELTHKHLQIDHNFMGIIMHTHQQKTLGLLDSSNHNTFSQWKWLNIIQSSVHLVIKWAFISKYIMYIWKVILIDACPCLVDREKERAVQMKMNQHQSEDFRTFEDYKQWWPISHLTTFLFSHSMSSNPFIVHFGLKRTLLFAICVNMRSYI